MVLEKFRIKRKIVVNSALPITFFIVVTWFVINIRYYYNVSTDMSENVHGNPPGGYKNIMKQPLLSVLSLRHRLRIQSFSFLSYIHALRLQRHNRHSLLQDEIEAQP